MKKYKVIFVPERHYYLTKDTQSELSSGIVEANIFSFDAGGLYFYDDNGYLTAWVNAEFVLSVGLLNE